VKLTEWLSLSGRVDAERWGNIDGRDKTLDPTDEPTKDVSAQGGRRLDLVGGLNVYIPRGPFKGQRFAVEVGAPVYQSLNGPQLQTDWFARAGWQWAF
jgi:murein DD-endopeptidase MepM/ murein hydrolase activator NlpD